MAREFVVEETFVHEGLLCAVVGSSLGHRCGYVGVPEGHPLHGKDYDGLNFRVHGGITYADDDQCMDYPVPAGLWWFGFDCGHAGDAKDPSLMDPTIAKIFTQSALRGGVIRTRWYVASECRSLAEQIAAKGRQGP